MINDEQLIQDQKNIRKQQKTELRNEIKIGNAATELIATKAQEKEKMLEKTLKDITRERGLSLTDEKSFDYRALVLEKTLRIVLPPRNQSDRTSLRRIANWIREECEPGHFDPDIIYRRVIDFAIEASGPGSKNPAAVFMSIVKKELGYKS